MTLVQPLTYPQVIGMTWNKKGQVLYHDLPALKRLFRTRVNIKKAGKTDTADDSKATIGGLSSVTAGRGRDTQQR